MKKITLIITSVFMIYGCGSSNQTENPNKPVIDSTLAYYGDTITMENTIPVTEVMKTMAGKDSMPMKVKGKIVDVCQKKGCWMEMDLGNNQSMRVTFKDYAFFVPKDAPGKTCYLEGYAHIDTTSVEELKHYAHDAGQSKEEIEKITEPEIELSFEAKGVIIKNEK
jgi:hypothetical protein